MIKPAPWLVPAPLPWRNSPGGLEPRVIKAPLFSLISQFISFQYSRCIRSKVVIKLKTSSRSFPARLPRPASGKNVIGRERGVISFFISLTGEGAGRREVEPESLTSWTLTLQWWFVAVGDVLSWGALLESWRIHFRRPPPPVGPQHSDDRSPLPGTPALSLKPLFSPVGFLWFCNTEDISQPEILRISIVGVGHHSSDLRGHKSMASQSLVYQEREKHPSPPLPKGQE